jgi:nucleotide-binding universal stress UspA family protein
MSGTIIVPLPGPGIDPEHISERSVPLARAIAVRTGASLLLLSVVDIPSVHHDLSDQLVLLPNEINHVSRRRKERIYQLREETIAERTAYLRDVADRCPGSDTDILIRYGDAADAILDVARSLDNPVIALATHCHSGLRRSVLGSVASRVVHDSPCPVFIARVATPNGHREPPQLHRILVPLDGSRLGELALWMGLRALGRHDLEVILLRVAYPAPDLAITNIFTGLEEEPAEAEYLQDVAREVAALGFDVRWQVETGKAEAVIRATAERAGADAIVMATHGRSGVSRLIFGSVTEAVLQGSTTPVLVIPASSAGTHTLRLRPNGQRRSVLT